jgi:hypothetical protein
MASSSSSTPPATSAVLRCANSTANCPNAGTSVCTSCKLVKVCPKVSPQVSQLPIRMPALTSHMRREQYCGKKCQQAHWKAHKSACKSRLSKVSWEPSWATSRRGPAFATLGNAPLSSFGLNKHLWGNMPAFDHVKLPENEGSNWKKPLDLCFAGQLTPPVRFPVKPVPLRLCTEANGLSQHLGIFETSSYPSTSFPPLTACHATS